MFRSRILIVACSLSLLLAAVSLRAEADTAADSIVPGNLISKVDPAFPKEAKKKKAHGTVELIATIDTDGNVSSIAISNGDMIFAEPAVDAVRNWKFEPYTNNGQPVEVWQRLEFDFTPGRHTAALQEQLPPAELAHGLPLLSHSTDNRVHGPMTPPKAIYAPDPEYSEVARKVRYQGVCVLSLVVGVDGLAHDIKVVRALGRGMDEKAVEGVSKWRFQPATQDGKPVSTQTLIEVSFHLY
jgi:TonB family protein